MIRSRRIEAPDATPDPEPDRISRLPLDILSCILSYLPTKQAVQTSILSNRWRYIWASVSNLDFDLSNIDKTKSDMFISYVERVIEMCMGLGQDIKRFSLVCSDMGNCLTFTSNITRWISGAVLLNVCELDIDAKMVELPSCLFCCKSLRVFKMKATCIRLPELSSHVSLPLLKVLELNWIWDDRCYGFLEKILCGCPMIEDLCLKGYHMLGCYILNLNVPALKRMKIHVSGHPMTKVYLNTPNLEFLNFWDQKFFSNYVIENVSSSLEACLDVGIRHPEAPQSQEQYHNKVIEFLKGISGAKSLSLSERVMWGIKFPYCKMLPAFCNLTCLELFIKRYNGWETLGHLLERSPSLQRLSINKVNEDDQILLNQEEVKRISQFPQKLPDCLRTCLQVVKLKGFDGSEHELKGCVEYVLGNAMVLETLQVELKTKMQGIKFRSKLLTFPIASKSCQVQVLDILA